MSNSTATAPLKDDASKTVTPVSGSDVKKDEPNKAAPAANSDKK